MKKSGKRMISFILTAVMVFALLPVIGNPMVVKAEDTPAEHVAHDEQCSAEETDCEYHKGWEKISTEKELMELGETGGSGYLVNNIKISNTFEIFKGKTVNLCLNGCSVIQTADKTDTITVEGTLNLYDKKDNFGKITHASEKRGRGVTIKSKGTFTMSGGTIIENSFEYDGGGVCNYGTFTMNGGTIEGNKAVYGCFGGGVCNLGTFTMNGGTIEKNDADYNGGGVSNGGTFTMNGGTIEKNEAGIIGGGVFSTGTFTMSGGTIEGNTADCGGGVYNYGTFTMINGAIKENNAKYRGGAVFIDTSFTKEGGEIDGSIESNGTLRTVTFKANDGSDNSIIQYVIPNEDTSLYSNKFNYGNYKFDCWNTEPDGTGYSYQDNATINVNSDLNLYARWIEKSYDVTFKVNNGSWSAGTKDDNVVTIIRYVGDKEVKLKASDIPNLADPATGYKGSWDTYPDTVNELTDNKTYTYTFEPIKYTVKYDSNGGEGTMDDQSRIYDDKIALTENAFTFEGKTFNGWNTAADGSGTPYANEEVNNISSKDGDIVTLYAQWTIDTFTITWKDYDGTVLETDSDVAYGAMPEYNGETPKRDDSANIKYSFSGWTPEIDTVKCATTYTATYSEEEIVEPTEPTTPEEPTEPGTEDLTDPESDSEIPDEDWLDDLRLQLRIADELGGPRTVTYSGDFALSYDIMLYLVEHPNITFIYTVTYEDVEYTITIPAGKAIADPEIPWYGPLWLLANYCN